MSFHRWHCGRKQKCSFRGHSGAPRQCSTLPKHTKPWKSRSYPGCGDEQGARHGDAACVHVCRAWTCAGEKTRVSFFARWNLGKIPELGSSPSRVRRERRACSSGAQVPLTREMLSSRLCSQKEPGPSEQEPLLPCSGGSARSKAPTVHFVQF